MINCLLLDFLNRISTNKKVQPEINMPKLTFNITNSDIETIDNCIACGGNDFSIISNCQLQDNGLLFFSTSICNECCHIFRNLIPSEQWFTKNFKIRYDFQRKNGLNPLNPNIEIERYQRYFSVGSLIKSKYPELISFLDVGCGPGTGFDALVKLGFYVEGIESDSSRSSIAKSSGYKIYEGDWQTYTTETKFDVISSIHSIEHFHDPKSFLKKMSFFAHSGTLLYLEVPEITDHVIDWNDSLYLAHVSNFNDHSLIKLASNSGWKLKERIYPYKQTALHKNHLSMIFEYSVESNPKSLKLNTEVKQNLKSEILKAYQNKLLKNNVDQTMHFIVKEINDLSLTYKKQSDVKEKVSDNYQNRTLTILNNNHLLVE